MSEVNTVLPDVRLRFNVAYPDLETCYAMGYECALTEGKEDENPFSQGSKEAYEWSDGWWTGFYGETPLYTLGTERAEDELERIECCANDAHYHSQTGFLIKVLELTGIIAMSALVGYQVIELVA